MVSKSTGTRTARRSCPSPSSGPRRLYKSRKRTRKKTLGGFRSKYEATVCEDLTARGHGYRYEPVKLKYTYEATYVPDLLLDNGVFVELKGFFSYEDRRKIESVLRCNPEIKLKILFYRDSKIAKNSKMTYSMWAEKIGIPYAVGHSIPEEWLLDE